MKCNIVDSIPTIFACFCGLQEEPPAEEPEDAYEDTTPQDAYEDITPEPAKSSGGLTAVAIYDYQAG